LYWTATGQSQSFSSASWLSAHKCQDNPSACVYEDLFKDDVPLRHVLTLAELSSGEVYLDRATRKMYIADDPTGHKMEATITTIALESDVGGVTVRGATIEKFGWYGLRAGGAGWKIEQNEVRYVHATGMRLSGSGHVVKHNFLHHNGNTGLVATDGSGLHFEENEIAFNNYLGFGMMPTAWHEGGVKMLKVSNVVVRNNYSHHNDGDGWWFDTDNFDIVVEDNFFSQNTRFGLFYEVSYRATIRRNVFRGNGTTRAWYGGAIWISTSKNVSVENNRFEYNQYSSFFVNSVARGSGIQGTYVTQNLLVSNNIFLMNQGWVGSSWGDDTIGSLMSNNRFENNEYRVNDLGRRWWIWRPTGFSTWQSWKGLGFDTSGLLAQL
jgi:hypothetical protein